MKKIINDSGTVVDEMIDGFCFAHANQVEKLTDFRVVLRKKKTDHVALISGGGSGHEPAHAGFVGDGMLAAAICGEVFTSPTPDQILEAIKASDTGHGVLLIVKNYTGDVMNFDMAKELAEMEDIKVESVLVDDDIAVEDSTYTAGKRGVAGTVLVHKILGAYARQGKTLEELKTRGDALVERIKTIGVALTAATVPEVGKPGFEIGNDEMEYGVGIHGEPGYKREAIKTSAEMAKELVSKLSEAFSFNQDQKYGVLINGLGATPLMEQYIFLNDVKQELDNQALTIAYTKVGNYMTSLDMAGVSLTVIAFETDEEIDALEETVDTPSWT
ncbi:dihydroxyacetone kinase DhaK subunit [Streptohalobacillus salinus]|uniref:Dihydroxyacetone kinase DhaK subunit n=1 Tax=Streptohalobacillus salinus TaxID=621096 RepID=A0A2V3W5C8_9BACI|nr:dihydroxyacetone kinase subunit DhaK [Streptohalobacillus salinus]PXW88308.1 dihydroxyacetone kinase DhaK subunit [Streptohalobacillus salinus]